MAIATKLVTSNLASSTSNATTTAVSATETTNVDQIEQ